MQLHKMIVSICVILCSVELLLKYSYQYSTCMCTLLCIATSHISGHCAGSRRTSNATGSLSVDQVFSQPVPCMQLSGIVSPLVYQCSGGASYWGTHHSQAHAKY